VLEKGRSCDGCAGCRSRRGNQDLCERILRQGAPGSLARSNLQQYSRGLGRHLRVIANFWSKVLLQTDRYNGSPFVLHMNLPIEPEHFERWLALFEETVKASLPVEYATKALAKARHMGESFKVGIFPFVDSHGKPARHPE
jgi:hypothetical protein